MASRASLGEVWLQIVPTMAGSTSTINREMRGIADAFADAMDRAVRAGADGAGAAADGISAATRRSADEAARHAERVGSQATGAIADGASDSVSRAANEMADAARTAGRRVDRAFSDASPTVDTSAMGNQIEDEVSESTEDGVEGGFAGAAGAVASAVAAWGVGDLLKDQLTGAFENENTFAVAGAKLALSPEEQKNLEGSVKDLYSGAYGESQEELTGLMTTIMSTSSKMRTATEKDLQAVGKNFSNLIATHDLDAESLARSFDAFQKYGMGSAEEYADMVHKMMSTLGPQGMDALDSLDEYMDEFRGELALTSDQLANMFANASRGGFRNTDVLADSLQEMGIKAEEAGEGWQEAVKTLGLNPGEISKAAKQGGKVWQDAYLKLMTKLQSKNFEQNTGLEIVGSMYEDNSSAFKQTDWANIFAAPQGVNIEGVAELDARLGSTGVTTFTSAMRTLEVAIQDAMIPIMEQLTPHLAELGKFLTENKEIIGPLAILIGGVLVAALTAFTIALAASGVAALANPIVWIVAAIVAAVAGLIALVVANWDTISGWFGHIGTMAGVAGEWIAGAFNNISSWIGGAINGIIAAGGAVGSFFQGIGASIGGFFSGVFGAIAGGWNGTVQFFTDAVGNIQNMLAGLGSWVTGLWENLMGFFRGLADFFKGIANFVIGAFNGVIRAINSVKIPIPNLDIAGFKPFGPMSGQAIGFNLAQIPALATGGDVMGPTLAMLAENGEPETVVNRGLVNRQLELVNERLLGGEGSGGETVIHVHPSPGMDEEALAEKVSRVIDRNRKRR